MPAVSGAGDAETAPAWVTERNNALAAKLVKLLDASKVAARVHSPAAPQVGGDHPVPQGQFVAALFQPFVWPTDSESQYRLMAELLKNEESSMDDLGSDVLSGIRRVIDGGLWVGKGADAARDSYSRGASIKFAQGDVGKHGSSAVGNAADDVTMTKKSMYTENTNAHKEIEQFLRSGSGQSLAVVGAILSTHRTAIQAYSAGLHTYATQGLSRFLGNLPESGGNNGDGGPRAKEAGNGTDSAPWSDGPGSGQPAPGPSAVGSSTDAGGVKSGAWSDGPGKGGIPGGPPSPLSAPWSDAPPVSAHNPLSTLLSAAGGGLPSMPSMPSGLGGGGLSSMSGFQGLMGGFGGFPGGGALSPAGLGSGFQGAPPLPNLGMSFGQGLAAGASAAGGIPSVPQAPMTPLVATPMESAPSAAAAPATAVAAPVAPATSGAGGVGGEGMSSYGSVLPPAAPGAGIPASAMHPEAGGAPAPASTAAGAGAGLMPVAHRGDGERVSRSVAESDLEQARMLVAELAGAAAVTDPGLDWAVAVGHNSSGMPTYWVATNDGATYIPPGVFLRKTMPIAAGLDAASDGRWMGWVNPAEKAVRAARECGDTVGAVATTWAWQSEYLADHPAVSEVATGVAPSSTTDIVAASLGLSRAHRLQTVDAVLYADLKAVDDDVLRAYCRVLTRQLAFGVAGDELTPVAQAVATALVAQQSPKAQEWSALSAEYEIAQALTGAQRPGLNGVENPDQVVSYCREFIRCRRMEALLCWEQFDGDLLNVVYAAWVAGIRAPLKDLALR
jgi:hypothetical protein